MPPDSETIRASHALLSGLVDYAGLFPPAKLGMSEAAANYARYVRDPDAWMLGRFILPVSRLEEFRSAAAGMLPKDADSGPWPISVLGDGELEADLDAIYTFNREHANARNGLAIIDAVELKVPLDGASPSVAYIDEALDTVPEDLFPFFELPVLHQASPSSRPDLRGCIAALAGADAAAKIRTGGVTPGDIPPSLAVAEFLVACTAAEVPFKATAGLHHPVRAEFPLTYQPDAPRAVMHGFVNVFVAAAAAFVHRPDPSRLVPILDETDPKAFMMTESSITWRTLVLDVEQLSRAREQFALSFGSCSFDEPRVELRAAGAID